MSLLNIGVQALQANQAGLSTVGQNIANVNTEGYSRQEVQYATREAPLKGVKISEIERISNEFLVRQVWNDTTAVGDFQAFRDQISQLDNLFASQSTSISAGMDKFFTSIQQAVDDPLSVPNRQLFLAEMQSLVDRFADVGSRLSSQLDTINTEIASITDEVNTLTGSIADLNLKIRVATSAGDPANEFKDQRDLLVKQLAEHVDINVVSQDGTELSVFMGAGQPLVVGSEASTLEFAVGNPDPAQVDIFLVSGNSRAEVTSQINSGDIGGLFRYRDDVLVPAINEVGRMAIVFADTMNEQHQKGMDLDGQMGGPLFNDINSGDTRSRISSNTDNETITSDAFVLIDDSSKLQASDYELVFNGSNNFTIIRKTDGARFESSDFTQEANSLDVDDGEYWINSPDNDEYRIKIDGLDIFVSGTEPFFPGDNFLIQAVKTGSSSMEMSLSNPRQLAFASPLRVEDAADNTGTAEVASVEVTDPLQLRPGQLQRDLEIVFSDAGGGNRTYTVYDISTDPGNPQPITVGGTLLQDQPYTSGQAIVLDGYQVTIANQPDAGDRFTIEYNTGGVSDNSNALAISNLQQADTFGDGKSYQDVYAEFLAKVGTQSNVAKISLESNQAVLATSENQLASVAGVNLDEEAANLIKFQQAYSAAAQLISASQNVFDSLISAVRG